MSRVLRVQTCADPGTVLCILDFSALRRLTHLVFAYAANGKHANLHAQQRTWIMCYSVTQGHHNELHDGHRYILDSSLRPEHYVRVVQSEVEAHLALGVLRSSIRRRCVMQVSMQTYFTTVQRLTPVRYRCLLRGALERVQQLLNRAGTDADSFLFLPVPF
jgi:hypothetical protein